MPSVDHVGVSIIVHLIFNAREPETREFLGNYRTYAYEHGIDVVNAQIFWVPRKGRSLVRVIDVTGEFRHARLGQPNSQDLHPVLLWFHLYGSS